MLQLDERPQVLVQLDGSELTEAMPLLQRGIFGLEIVSFASPHLLDGDWVGRLQQLQPLLQGLPGPLTMHGPFLDMSPSSPEPRLRQLTKDRYRQALQIAGRLGARYLVLHSQFNPNLPQPNYPKLWLEGNLRFWAELQPELEASQTTILLENMWDRSPDHLAALLRQLPPEQFAACLDTGHANIYSPVTWTGWVQALGERLAYIHVSDNHGGWDQHLAAGQGSIDFPDLLRTLAASKCRPWFVLEVTRLAEARASLRHLGWEGLLAGRL